MYAHRSAASLSNDSLQTIACSVPPKARGAVSGAPLIAQILESLQRNIHRRQLHHPLE